MPFSQTFQPADFVNGQNVAAFPGMNNSLRRPAERFRVKKTESFSRLAIQRDSAVSKSRAKYTPSLSGWQMPPTRSPRPEIRPASFNSFVVLPPRTRPNRATVLLPLPRRFESEGIPAGLLRKIPWQHERRHWNYAFRSRRLFQTK